MLTLRDIMTSDVFTVSPDLPLADLLELLSSRHIGGAPVVSGGKVVGVVSASDLLTFAATLTAKREQSADGTPERWEEDAEDEAFDAEEPSSRYFTHLWEESPEALDVEWDEVASDGRSALHEYTAADVMSRDVKSLLPLTEVAAAADFMNAAGIHRVLVMTDDHLDGIVTSMDIVDAVAKHQIPAPQLILSREREFETDWSHEPVVPERDGRD